MMISNSICCCWPIESRDHERGPLRSQSRVWRRKKRESFSFFFRPVPGIVLIFGSGMLLLAYDWVF